MASFLSKLEFCVTNVSERRSIPEIHPEKVEEDNRDENDSEPISPIKFADTINKHFRINNSNIMRFVSK